MIICFFVVNVMYTRLAVRVQVKCRAANIFRFAILVQSDFAIVMCSLFYHS